MQAIGERMKCGRMLTAGFLIGALAFGGCAGKDEKQVENEKKQVIAKMQPILDRIDCVRHGEGGTAARLDKNVWFKNFGQMTFKVNGMDQTANVAISELNIDSMTTRVTLYVDVEKAVSKEAPECRD